MCIENNEDNRYHSKEGMKNVSNTWHKGVISYGSQTKSLVKFLADVFESSVISYGSQTM